MPIVIKDFKWRQTINTVIIQVPLKGIHQSKVDIFTSSKYIKASYSPYFFEVFLASPIQVLESKCTLTANEMVFELLKEEKCNWEKLELDLPRSEKNKLKKELIEEEHKRFQKECEDKLDKKSKLQRLAVNEQITLDTIQRKKIDNIRNNEKENALGDLKQWRDSTEPSRKIIELPSSSESEEEKEKKEEKVKIKKATKPHMKYIRRPHYNLKKSELKVSVPLPRSTATVEVSFTQREFPTPCRESRMEEENEWLRKQAEVKRSVGFHDEDLRPEEKNPQYLKAKGDEFLKAKNYLAAVSAYTFGIKLSPQYVDLYIKRSEAHFAVGNMQRTINDCSEAIELMKPEVSANFLDRVTCIVRRGKALVKFGMKKEGFTEIEAAYKMQPYNEEIKQLLHETLDELNNTTEEKD